MIKRTLFIHMIMIIIVEDINILTDPFPVLIGDSEILI